MNEYGFDYLNYISNVPNQMKYGSNKTYSNMNYGNQPFSDMNYVPNQSAQVQMMNTTQLLEPYQGFMRGNMFANLYDPYKNYKPMELNPENEREALLYQILQYQFALTDLDLYLDTHPNDQEAIHLYQKYLTIKQQASSKYENMYGPLTLNSRDLDKNTWVWKNSPWPWEGV